MNLTSMEVSMFWLVFELRLFWMNNKPFIGFSFCIIWRIIEILEGIIRLSLIALLDNTLSLIQKLF